MLIARASSGANHDRASRVLRDHHRPRLVCAGCVERAVSAHTPGPWCVAPLDGVYHGDTSKTKYHAVKKFWPGPGAYERVADCSGSAYPEANAKLIAAAPDLAEVLREIAAGGWSDAIEPVALARAALTKAGL